MIPERLKNITEDLRSQDWMRDLLNVGEVYIVGGTVRDAYMDSKIKDIDCIIEGPNMREIKSILRVHGRVDEVGESFAVIKFRPHGYEGEDFDIAVPREDTKTGEGHQGFTVNTENVSLDDDLLRRDFTINSIAVNVETDELVDPFHGLGDIRRGIIRATDPGAFAEDPLRILRGIQFAARFGFEIEHETMILMQNYADDIRKVSGERIFDELIKVLRKDGDTQVALDLLHQTDVDEALFDKKMLKYDQGFEHIDEISFFYVLGLLGDVDPAGFLKKRLKADNRLVLNVRTLDNIFKNLPHTTREDDLKMMLFKAFNKAPDVMEAIILPEEVQNIRLQMRTMKIPMDWGVIQIDGDDIKEISGIEEGPEIGQIKDTVLRDALMNRFNWKDRTDSLEYLEKLIYGN